MAVSGRGKEIKQPSNRYQRVNRALNAAIRRWKSDADVAKWQRILINFYERIA